MQFDGIVITFVGPIFFFFLHQILVLLIRKKKECESHRNYNIDDDVHQILRRHYWVVIYIHTCLFISYWNRFSSAYFPHQQLIPDASEYFHILYSVHSFAWLNRLICVWAQNKCVFRWKPSNFFFRYVLWCQYSERTSGHAITAAITIFIDPFLVFFFSRFRERNNVSNNSRATWTPVNADNKWRNVAQCRYISSRGRTCLHTKSHTTHWHDKIQPNLRFSVLFLAKKKPTENNFENWFFCRAENTIDDRGSVMKERKWRGRRQTHGDDDDDDDYVDNECEQAR